MSESMVWNSEPGWKPDAPLCFRCGHPEHNHVISKRTRGGITRDVRTWCTLGPDPDLPQCPCKGYQADDRP